MNDDLISRKAAILQLSHNKCGNEEWDIAVQHDIETITQLSSAQQTLYGYNIEHLELIARILQKEDLPPERIVEALTDIGRIVAIVKDEFEEALRNAVEQCMI